MYMADGGNTASKISLLNLQRASAIRKYGARSNGYLIRKRYCFTIACAAAVLLNPIKGINFICVVLVPSWSNGPLKPPPSWTTNVVSGTQFDKTENVSKHDVMIINDEKEKQKGEEKEVYVAKKNWTYHAPEISRFLVKLDAETDMLNGSRPLSNW